MKSLVGRSREESAQNLSLGGYGTMPPFAFGS